ncbi:hypothetical protein MVEN_00893700 [Mycena venus]|uniref:Uncharacterized protein n=1 Tax=Mycena venus TaxID=2733690 RepID=A0A8H6YH25_9AGAR|nr:hypothetical protein MVEN_00893700 [Mycena venus]
MFPVLTKILSVEAAVDGSCNVVHILTTSKNVCNQGIFRCAPGPVFNGYISITSLRHVFHPDPNAGSYASVATTETERLWLPNSQYCYHTLHLINAANSK